MHAYLFDVDGVLLDETGENRFHPELIDQIVTRLNAGHPVGFNTGRSVPFLSQHILPYLESHTSSADKHMFFVSSEKGSVTLIYDKDKRIISHDASLDVPENLKQSIVRYAATTPYVSEILALDATKESMISLELKQSASVGQLERVKDRIIDDLTQCITSSNQAQHVHIDHTSISIDIEHIKSGKALGTEQFLAWLTAIKCIPASITIFGDSRMDVDMLIHCVSRDIDSRLIFVGDPKRIRDLPQDNIVYSQQKNCAATLEALRNNA